MKIRSLFLVIGALLFAQHSWAQENIILPQYPQLNRYVTAIEVDEQYDRIYLGGNFDELRGGNSAIIDPNFMVIDRTTGDIIETPSIPNGIVFKIATAGDYIIATGDFTQFGDSLRAGIAALDRATLEVTPWGRNLAPLINDVTVRDIEIDENRVYYTGKTSFLGNTQINLGALDLETGELLDWPTESLSMDDGDQFLSLALADTSVFVGGNFFIIPSSGGGFVDNVLEIGKSGGELTDFRVVETLTPFGCCNKISRANEMVVYENDLIVAGVLHIGGDGIGKVDLETGELIPLANAGLPSGGDPFNNEFYAGGFDLELSGTTLYFAAEAFTGAYSFETNQYVDVYSNTDWYNIVFDGGAIGSPRWDPIYTARAICSDQNGTVYVGGNFNEILDSSRKGFAVLEECVEPLAGTVFTSSETLDICLNDGIVNEIQAEVEGNTGQGAFVYHDADYNISAAKTTGLFFPGSIPPGEYFISHVAYTYIESANITNLNDLRGCYSLSNALPVNTFVAEAGNISTQDVTSICVADLPITISVDRVNSTGLNQGFALLTSSNQIVSINADSEVLFDGLSPGNYKILSVSTQTDVDLEEISPSNIPDCFDASNAIVVNITACEELLIASNPNPVVDVSQVSFTTVESENVQLELFDLTGKRIGLIYAGMAPGQTPMMFQYDTSSLPQGVYIYKLTTESEVKTTKFLKN